MGLSLKTRISAIILVLFALGIWGTTLSVASRLKSDVLSLLQEQLVSEASYLAKGLEAETQFSIQVLQSIVSQIDTQLFQHPIQLQQYLKMNPDLYLSFSNGIVVISNDGYTISQYPEMAKDIDQFYGNNDYFQQVVANNAPFVGKPMLNTVSNTTELVFAVPIFDSNQHRMGVLAAFANLSDSTLIRSIFNTKASDFTDRILLVSSRDKVVVAGSDKNRHLEDVPVDPSHSVFDQFMAGQDGVGVYTDSRQMQLIAAASNIPSLGWFVRVGIPTSMAFMPINHMLERIYLVGLFFSSLMGLLACYALSRLLKPLGEVATKISKMSQSGAQLQLINVSRQDEIGKLCSAFNSLVDERKKLETQYLQLARIVDTTRDPVISTSLEGCITSWNPAAEAIFGYSAVEMMDKSIYLLFPEISPSHQQKPTNKFPTLDSFETQTERKDGVRISISITISAILDDQELVSGISFIARDVSEKKLVEEEIWKQANYDFLTGLPNFRLVKNRIEQAIKMADRSEYFLVLFFVDLDRFKDINDSLGHAMGDELLKQAAQRMLDCVRETDTVGRFAGDEFIVMLGEVQNVNNAASIANKILTQLEKAFRLGSEIAHISASIGITVYPNDGSDIETLLGNADQALYAAKRQGRNRYRFYVPSMQDDSFNRLRITHDLHAALPQKELVVYYQPIMDLNSGLVYKAEALLRWKHPMLGMISPAIFVPIAEKIGKISEIGDWVFQQAASALLYLRETIHPEFQISVNRSPLQFTEIEKKTEWPDYLAFLGLPGHSVVIEITENLLMQASELISTQLLIYRDRGIQVALDDFGTGYSSLSYLRRFDIDYIKIDQSFVKTLTANSNELILCEAITVMAHRLGLKVIAEGIETDEQYQLIRQMGCDYGQGFLFAKPMPFNEFESYLQNTNLT